MPDAVIESLLELQKRDERHMRLLKQLKELPLQIADFEQKIADRKDALEQAQQELKEAEVRRKDLEGQMSTAEEQIAKFRNQQLMVKKNEEYTALEHEIENEQSRIGQLEEDLILLMDRIDALKAEFAEEEKLAAVDIEENQSHIARLQGVKKDVEAEAAEARQHLDAATAATEPDAVRQYEYVKTQVKRGPFVVKMQDKQCQGCFLKVSAEAEAEVREGKSLVRCPNCKRILYI